MYYPNASNIRGRFSLALALAALLCAALAVSALAVVTERISVNSLGIPGNSWSVAGNMSADGRYIVLCSSASNFVDNDTNGFDDIFVFDRQTGIMERVSVATGNPGTQANGPSLQSIPDNSGYNEFASMSTDGRYVVFSSTASNLVSSDTNGVADIFVRDRTTNTTTRVSVSSSGLQSNGPSYFASISADGKRVAFISTATNLVAGDTNNAPDVFVRDIPTGKTYRVNLSSAPANAQATGQRTWIGASIPDSDMTAWISGDGQHVAIISSASNLVTSDTNEQYDAFVRDLDSINPASGNTERVSVSSTGQQPNGMCWAHCNYISYNGSIVTFSCRGDNLVPGDTNGVLDVFVRNRTAGTTTRVSIPAGGGQFTTDCSDPTCSSDGSVIGFNVLSSDGTTFSTYTVNRDGTGIQNAAIASGGSPMPGSSVFSIPGTDPRYLTIMNFRSMDEISNCQVYFIDKSAITISDAKALANDASVIVSGGVVTAAFNGMFYFQQDGIASPSRVCGIQVQYAGSVTVGKRYIITGSMKTDNNNGERYILATAVDPLTSTWTLDVKPLGMRNKNLGLGDWKRHIPDHGEGQIGITGEHGVNNVGMLVRIWGRVKSIDPSVTPTWFTVDDGSGIAVKCDVPSGVTIQPTWDRLVVTGICRLYKDGNNYTRRISVRNLSDIKIISLNP